jgi:phosphoglycolate phosphatase
MASFTPRLLVFDLDGTLIDSRIDLCNSVNAMLSHFGKYTLAEPTIASYIGDGASTLVRRALAHAHLVADEPDPHDDTFIVEATSWFIDWYRVHKLDYTYVYPGVLESLALIRERHPALPMAVLTNKPVHPSRDICRHFNLDRYCYQIYGGNSFESKKPDPEGLLTLIAEAERLTSTLILPSETVMIGDSHVDVETARACGVRSLGCTFGLSPESLAAAGPDMSVDDAGDWPRVLNLL